MATFDKQAKYIEALLYEIETNKDKLKNIETIFIGGGTPSSIAYELQGKLLKKIKSIVDLNQVKEYSIETNPNDITDNLVSLWHEYGIDRVSVGVQTFNDKHLKFLGRDHKAKDIKKAIAILRSHGIHNISIDLIFSLIDQTLEEVAYDVKQFLTLEIDHLSYYSLILEEKTKLMYLYDRNMIELNDEDLESDMYLHIINTLEANDYKQYEISNFTKNKRESLHNSVYWTNKEYIGVGSGAHSLINNYRYYNIPNVREYTFKVLHQEEYRTFYERDEFSEECIMGLRLLKGIAIDEINQKYQMDLLNDIPELREYINKDYLEIETNRLKFTRKGLMVGNLIFGLFLGGR